MQEPVGIATYPAKTDPGPEFERIQVIFLFNNHTVIEYINIC